MGIVVMIIQGIIGLVIIDAVLSWLQTPNQVPRKYTQQITAVLYAPIHVVIKPQMTGGLDIAPLIVIIALQFIRGLLV